MSFRQGLRFTVSYLSISFILCGCIGAFWYLSNMIGEPLFQLQMEEGILLRFFGEEMRFSAQTVQRMELALKRLFYFLPPYERAVIRLLNVLFGQ